MSDHPIRVAIAGVGNCATSLVQGVHFYRDADPSDTVPGLMHVQFGDYHVRDVDFVAAFDVDAAKVGLDLSQAVLAAGISLFVGDYAFLFLASALTFLLQRSEAPVIARLRARFVDEQGDEQQEQPAAAPPRRMTIPHAA